MKKRCLFLAIMLVAMQAVMIFTPLSASAESLNRSYNIYKTEAEITVDGVADAAWADASYSELFIPNAEEIPEKGRGFEAKLQALWAPVANDATMLNVYFLLTVKDPTPNVMSSSMPKWASDSFGFNAYYGDELCWTGQTAVENVVNNGTWFGNNDGAFYRIQKGIVDNRQAATNPTDYYTVEIGCQLPKADAITFEFWVIDNFMGTPNGGHQITYAWNGGYVSTVAEGKGNILHSKSEIDETDDVLFEYEGQVVASANKSANNTVTLPDYELFGTLIGWKDAAGNLYPVGGTYTVTGSEQIHLTAVSLQVSDYELLPGACALIEEPTAIRFEVGENAAALAALGTVVQEKGVIIVQTSLLTEAILADGTFSAEELTAAGIAFDKIVFTTAKDGIYGAVKENITDVSVSYSAVSYLSVKYTDESVHSITSNYNETLNARSIKAIAEAAYADRETVRATVDGVNYKFKVSKNYAIGDFTMFSYSPYTEEQLDLLAKFKK